MLLFGHGENNSVQVSLKDDMWLHPTENCTLLTMTSSIFVAHEIFLTRARFNFSLFYILTSKISIPAYELVFIINFLFVTSSINLSLLIQIEHNLHPTSSSPFASPKLDSISSLASPHAA